MGLSADQRFEAKIDRSGGTDACHLWTASKFSKGYGAFSYMGRNVSASVYAWEREHGPIPEGLTLRHIKCNTRACVNAAHLGVGTMVENIHDKWTHGTMARGERQGSAVLTKEQVLEAADLRRAGMPWKEIARAVSANQCTIIEAVLHRNGRWRHVETGIVPKRGYSKHTA